MKKLLLTISLILLMSVSTFADDTPVPLKRRHPIEHSHQKSPADYSYLPAVIYDDEAETLSFEANADLGLVPYTVTDENGIVVLSGTVNIYVGNTPTVSLSTLTAGDYTLTIEVSGTDFEGEFTI